MTKEEKQAEYLRLTQALDKVSEQGIRHVLYTMIKVYPYEAKIVIDAIILKQKEVI